MKHIHARWTLSLALAGLIATSAAAQDYMSSPYPAQPANHVSLTSMEYQSLLARLAALENRVNAQEEPEEDWLYRESEWEDVSGEKWSADWGGRIMFDYVTFAGQNADSFDKFGDQQNYVEARRMRFFVDGAGYGVYDYKLQIDVASEEGVEMKDAYWGIHEIPYLNYVRFGHFKAPFSLEELTSSKYITFMERSLPNVFAPGREIGAAAYQTSCDQNATLAYGVFYDDVDEVLKERINDNQGTTFAARATFLPYYDRPSGGRYHIETGVNFRYTDDWDNLVRFRARPETHEGDRFIDTGNLVADDFFIVGWEGAVVAGPFSVQSEVMWTSVEELGGDEHDFWGAYAYASWFLTGEHRPLGREYCNYGRVRPYTNFWWIPGCCGSGAVEAKARWSYLDLSGTADAESGIQHDFTTGFNWYWNPYIRWMFEYRHTWNSYTNDARRPETDILGARGQVDF